MIHTLVRSSLALSLPAALAAQTFIVDASNGPGTHFLDIPPAVAAVPDGAALRVRAGIYSAFTAANKSLTILGDSNGTVEVPSATVGPLAQAQRVVLKAMKLRGLQVTGAQGAVHLESMIIPGSPIVGWSTGVSIQNCANVHLQSITGDPILGAAGLTISRSCVEIDRCTFTGPPQPTASAAGFAAVHANNSHVVVSGSTLTGGRGGTDLFQVFGDGGAAFHAESSDVDLGRGNLLTGGEGGIDPVMGTGCYYVMRPGGPGLRLTSSVARARGTTLAGGRGPCFVCSTQPPCTTLGPPLIADGGSTFTTPAGIAPQARLQGLPARNSFVDFVLSGAANELALLGFGFTPACVALPAIIDFGGILTLPEIVVGPFVTNSVGTTSYRLTLPNDFVLDRMVWAQYFTFPGAVLPGMGSNTVTLVVPS